mgnify:CR=1 FL=1
MKKGRITDGMEKGNVEKIGGRQMMQLDTLKKSHDWLLGDDGLRSCVSSGPEEIDLLAALYKVPGAIFSAGRLGERIGANTL